MRQKEKSQHERDQNENACITTSGKQIPEKYSEDSKRAKVATALPFSMRADLLAELLIHLEENLKGFSFCV